MTGRLMEEGDVRLLRDQGFFDSLDIHFARLMERLCGGASLEVFIAASLASRATRLGNICFPLFEAAGRPLPGAGNLPGGPVACPPLELWTTRLWETPVVGRPGEEGKPLVLDSKGRLYLYRYWRYEKDLASAILGRVSRGREEADLLRWKEPLERLFPPVAGEPVDWQKVAALMAVSGAFTVLTGGPGTGKTTVVAKIIALLLESGGRGLRIALTAPTGKGAVRMEESILQSLEKLDLPPDLKEVFPREAATLHRLLGASRGTARFRHHEGNPLPFDAVVVDEASMVDLPLLSRLVGALKADARIILLGDKDQLASVEAGAVLGDICDTGRLHGYAPDFRKAVGRVARCVPEALPGETDPPPMAHAVAELRKNWRFHEQSGIGMASRAIREGEGDRAVSLFKSGNHGDLLWKAPPRPRELRAFLKPLVLARYGRMPGSRDVGEIFGLFNAFRILCAVREGPYGVDSVNALVEGILREEGAIGAGGRWYEGRPVMVTVNDYRLGLYNGDVGIVLPDGGGPGDRKAYFLLPGGALRKVHPLRLPEHETAFAMTVHKSQGSEFDEVALVLPDRPLPLLTRELLYTAVTRAKKRITILGRDPVLREAVSRRTRRDSGLRDLLWDRDGV